MKPRQPGVNVTTPAPDQAARYRRRPDPEPEDARPEHGVRRPRRRRPPGPPVRELRRQGVQHRRVLRGRPGGVPRGVPAEPPASRTSSAGSGRTAASGASTSDRDGKIDEWVVISPEEVSQELLAGGDHRATPSGSTRCCATEGEPRRRSGLPAAEVARIKEKAAGAGEAPGRRRRRAEARRPKREVGPPRTRRPAHHAAGRLRRQATTMVVHKNGTVLIEDKGKTHFLQTGELVQVGRAWKVVEGPSAGPACQRRRRPAAAAPARSSTPEIQDLVDAARRDRQEARRTRRRQPALAEYNAKRPAMLEQIVPKLPGRQAGRRGCGCWSTASPRRPRAASRAARDHKRLQQWKDALSKPGRRTRSRAYAAFRLLVAENGMALANAEDRTRNSQTVQDKWRTGLEEFVKAHPTADDAAEAVLRLAMAYEFLGKDGEAEGEGVVRPPDEELRDRTRTRRRRPAPSSGWTARASRSN